MCASLAIGLGMSDFCTWGAAIAAHDRNGFIGGAVMSRSSTAWTAIIFKGRAGDCINAVLAAGGYNFGPLLRCLAVFFACHHHGARRNCHGSKRSLKPAIAHILDAKPNWNRRAVKRADW